MKLSSENASVKWKILKFEKSSNYPLLSVAWLVTLGLADLIVISLPGIFPAPAETFNARMDWECDVWEFSVYKMITKLMKSLMNIHTS